MNKEVEVVCKYNFSTHKEELINSLLANDYQWALREIRLQAVLEEKSGKGSDFVKEIIRICNKSGIKSLDTS